MPFRIVLIAALLAQIAAAVLALRLNFRYRVYSAWFLISAAAFTMAILRFSTLMDFWTEPPTIQGNLVLWASTLTSLLGSLFLFAGLALIEPFFQAIGRAQDTLQREHQRLQSVMEDTEEELRLARSIQHNLLPKEPPPAPGLEVAGDSQAAEWTSGDYYDYVPLQNGGTAFIIADVSGHGLGPAMLASAARASIRALARTFDDVGELLTQTNAAVSDAVSGRGFITAFVAVIHPETRELHYAAAGHNAYLLRAHGARQILSTDGPPLGVIPDVSLTRHRELPLESGDILILVTDGILETADSDGHLFGEDRLFENVAQHQCSSAEEILAGLFSAAHDFGGHKPQSDDNTAVVIKVA